MQFYEKLAFLMNLTQATNRMLAQALQVDASLISRLRTGARGLPRNREIIKGMSLYFAKRCTIEYQRQALSEMLGIKQALAMKNDQLSEILYYWLCGETDEVDQFMRTFEILKTGTAPDKPETESYSLSVDNCVYYGNDGKRAAVRAVCQHLLSLEKPCPVFVLADEADDWILEDYEFSGSLRRWGLDLIQKGFQFYQIVPPANSGSHALGSLMRWLPLYMTGKVAPYFYPRIRDNVHRRTLVVVPGEIAMASDSIATQRLSFATLLTTDQRLVQAFGGEFQDCLALCRPMLNAYFSSEKQVQCFTQFISSVGTRIQRNISLSAETAPPELISYCLEKIESPDLKKLSGLYFQDMEFVMQNQGKQELIEIANLASAQEVRDGKVPILLSCGVTKTPLCYTPELYVLHLQNILHFMQTCDNYHFVPIRRGGDGDCILMVKEGYRVLFVRTVHPSAVFEVGQPDIVRLTQEHLFQLADRIGYRGIHRIKIMSQIKELIRELQA